MSMLVWYFWAHVYLLRLEVGTHYFQSMALVFIVLSLVVYSYDDDYYSVTDWTWTEFEIIWRPVHDYEMIYIQQWELFMYLHVSDLCIVMQCIMIMLILSCRLEIIYLNVLTHSITSNQRRYSPISRIFIDWENAAPMWRLDKIGRFYS